MDDKEFIEVYAFIESSAARYKKRNSNDWLELTVLLFKKINKEMDLDYAKSRVLNVIRGWHKIKKADEYYEPDDLYEKNEYGNYIEIGVSDHHRIHTAYGKDISVECIGCRGRYIKTSKNQKYCTPQCRKRSIYKNICK